MFRGFRIFKPKFVVIQLSKLGIKISKFASDRNIKVILVNTEDLLQKKYSTFYPEINKIKKLTKIFCSTYSEKSFLISKKFKSKVILSGSLRYCSKKKKSFKNKTRAVGIISTNKYLTSRFSNDLIKELYHRQGDGRKIFQDFIAYELAFFDF